MMHPLLEAKIEQLDRQLDALHETFKASREELAKQHKEKEELLQEQWRQRKHMATLDRLAKDYDALEAENKRFQSERKRIRDGLRAILKLTKSLRNGQRP
jgi:hypothetical protein